jgi:hypothetical protein
LEGHAQRLGLLPVDGQMDAGSGGQAVGIDAHHHLALRRKAQQLVLGRDQCGLAASGPVLQPHGKTDELPSSSMAGGQAHDDALIALIAAVVRATSSLTVAPPRSPTFRMVKAIAALGPAPEKPKPRIASFP